MTNIIKYITFEGQNIFNIYLFRKIISILKS